MLLQTTKDGKWVLVKGQGTMGWIPASHVAKVDKNFVYQWKHSKFVTPTVRKQDLLIHRNNVKDEILEAGSVLPARYGNIQVPIRDASGQARLITVETSNLKLAPWPMKPSYKNFAEKINSLIGMPYGWGGKDFNNDCSGLLRRLFISFGIWLPRSSYWQANYMGTLYSLYGESESQRKDWLIDQNGPTSLVPFMTLVSFGNNQTSTSHIGLYMGTTKYNNQEVAVIFNAPWGVQLVNDNSEHGRAFVGQTLITPVGIGDEFSTGLSEQGWSLMSLWARVGFNVTLLTQPPEKKQLQAVPSSSSSVKQYLLWK